MDAKHKILFAAAALMVCAGIYAWRFGEIHPGTTVPGALPTAKSPQAKDAVVGSDQREIASGQTELGGRLQKYQCVGKDCSRSPYFAESRKEAAWLLEHGYPAPEELANLRQRSTAQYEAEFARTHGEVARSLYGLSLAADGQAREALGVLGSGAARGNLYALDAISEIYYRSPEFGNLVLSAAYLRLAYLAGDRKAGETYARRFEVFTPPEHASADRNAARLHRQLMQDRVYPRP